uniref:Signal recognition particle receptor subunit beta n=1 Tax=Lynceus sp. MCZ IZ 141354 TaxID=1930659 RepID=A0A9N6ZHC5_9CRUS|nr:EOG090X0C7N [Lynceus sp. MCZ IZ 141354]
METFTSMKENTIDYFANEKKLKLIDVPGHERVRYKFIDGYKNSAKGIIFMIDSATFTKDLRDVAEFLYILLTDGSLGSKVKSVIVLCNKQDLPLSKGAQLIKSQLEKEMNILRTTKSSQLEGTSEIANNNTFLGKTGKDFEFSHLNVPVLFEQCNLKSENPDLTSVTSWLTKLA